MAERPARPGSESAAIDWEVFAAAEAIADKVVGRDARHLGDAIAGEYRSHLEKVVERITSGGDFRDEHGRVSEARIRGYLNAGPRRELRRIRAGASATLEESYPDEDDARSRTDDRAREHRAGLVALIPWACRLRRPVAITAVARAEGASYLALEWFLGIKRNTLLQCLLRATRRAPAQVLREAGFLLPVPGVRPRGRDDENLVRRAAAVVDRYRQTHGIEDR